MTQEPSPIRKVYFYWVCDKSGCEKTNYRVSSIIKEMIDDDTILLVNDDICDECIQHIHEPIITFYDPYEQYGK